MNVAQLTQEVLIGSKFIEPIRCQPAWAAQEELRDSRVVMSEGAPAVGLKENGPGLGHATCSAHVQLRNRKACGSARKRIGPLSPRAYGHSLAWNDGTIHLVEVIPDG